MAADRRLFSYFLVAVVLLAGCQSAPTSNAALPTSTPSAETQAAPEPAATQPQTTLSPVSASPAPQLLNLALIPVVDGLTRPVYLTYSPDDSNRLFIVEQPGTIRILKDGTLLPDPFLDLTGVVNSTGNEQGLLGLAFHPEYRQNGFFFILYTADDRSVNIARMKVLEGDPDRADMTSMLTLLAIPHTYKNHNGGQLVFGPDGYLYIGVGDGGSAGDPDNNGQSLNTLLGKILRIDVNTEPYGIPPDNPFVGRTDAKPEIWAYGLRNPWRFSFDRLTGDLFIGDVGQDAYEEIDYQPAGSPGGANYGWSFMEGLHAYKGAASDGLTPPIAEYPHSGGSCSVTGGYVYRGSALPQLYGAYIFGDYCSGEIWKLNHVGSSWPMAELMIAPFQISSFSEDQNGNLYVLDLSGGAVYLLGTK